jgi:hypothetical protein
MVISVFIAFTGLETSTYTTTSLWPTHFHRNSGPPHRRNDMPRRKESK